MGCRDEKREEEWKEIEREQKMIHGDWPRLVMASFAAHL